MLGLIYRALTSDTFVRVGGTWLQPVSLTFLIGVPVCMGFIAAWEYLHSTPQENVRWYKWIGLACGSVTVMAAISLLFKWEGFICVGMAVPIWLILAILGAIAARILSRNIGPSRTTSLCVAALPLILFAVEAHIDTPPQIRAVHTEILIHAPADVVWRNIRSVSAIAPAELPSAWVNRIGFPLPIAATLSHNGVGGVRQATFTGGLLFTETIDRWQPGQDLAFSIHANTASIPPTTLDEHVTIGGQYFDVLDGEYSLEPRPDGILLHLTSHQRLSTHVNLYAGLWTDSIMRSIQNQILYVVRNRCEATR